ncbi:DUF3524 domain-containing protein, partial [Desulfobacterales bacterium HSG16]|nr:DUF3524 domain-containing protein [Desulfobacterales bacterium HSG16]
MKFIFLESFFGGSHQDFAKGFVENSRHEIELLTLPPRFWKWRMRGAALYFLKKIPDLSKFDGLITTDLMSLSDFKGLSGGKCPASAVYFHENQLTYPLSTEERMDYHFGFTDITTCLAADRVFFNSKTHFDSFFKQLPPFLRIMPEFKPRWVIDAIYEKSSVLYPGCRFPAVKEKIDITRKKMPPLIIWNHRWEFDKNPEDFFLALDQVEKKGFDFRIAVLGERFKRIPKVFDNAKERFKDRIIQFGYIESKSQYFDMLKQGSVAVSTAVQENFGISMVESMRAGCVPLLPDRLSYPEILPQRFHEDCLYKDVNDLVKKLCTILSDISGFLEKSTSLCSEMDRYSWDNMIHEYDYA